MLQSAHNYRVYQSGNTTLSWNLRTRKIKPAIAKENGSNNGQKSTNYEKTEFVKEIVFGLFIYFHLKKNKNTSNTTLEQVLNKFGSDIKLFKRDNISTMNSAKVKLQSRRRTPRVGFVHKQLSDSHACAPSKTILDYIKLNKCNEFILKTNFKKLKVLVNGFCLKIN